MALGSLGAFLVLEAREHAIARNAKPLAPPFSGRIAARPLPSATAASLSRMWQELTPRLDRGHVAVISGATGRGTRDERRASMARKSARCSGAGDRHISWAWRSSRSSR